MKSLTFANRWNADLIEANYQRWLHGDAALDPLWEAFFEGFELAGRHVPATTDVHSGEPVATTGDSKIQARAIGAIYAYRAIGHTQATINPLLIELPINPRLALDRLGFREADLDHVVDTGNYLGGKAMRVGELIEGLRETYCGNVGVEYLHIQETAKRRWIQSRIEPTRMRHEFSPEEQKRILCKIIESELFEKHLHHSFVGQKRFSLEGAETLIAALDAVAQHCPRFPVHEIVMGMAHRGRLNVLANFVGKSCDLILREFSEHHIPVDLDGDGDVKYHLGYENTWETESGNPITVRLAANPSHLEAVNAVVEGRARARQRILGQSSGSLDRGVVLPLLIHGDAAIAGQGTVAEVLNFSKLKGYRTGGTLHVVINNQIGFTTDPADARSSQYCTDIAKMIEAPVFHVNGEDPLAVAHVCVLALEYRQQFGEDVFVDMLCYRRHGHNETDEPAFTQPELYRKIASIPLTSVSLAARMEADGVLAQGEADEMRASVQRFLDHASEKAAQVEVPTSQIRLRSFEGSSAITQPDYNFKPVETGVAADRLAHVAKVLCTPPDGFEINPKIARMLATRHSRFEQGGGIDWAFGESLAFGTLLMEGTPVRLSGQDCERGTFSQRHSVIHDIHTRDRYVPLLNLGEDQAQFCVHNSLLSEAAVLGFDYGYSVEYPQMLCLWEAQFGDFANGAQVIIDQFIASSESKWGRVSGIVMLLPHGYEGQGPEHSSARLERFLQLCAESNIQVCNITTPAQYFHVLRRQMKRDFRKPLIIMSPKSLLRHPAAVSPTVEFQTGRFQGILDDPKPGESVERVILCSGKVYYDLIDYREKNGLTRNAIVRVEQLYPLNRDLLLQVVGRYGDKTRLIWCQEESRNMGAWTYIAPLLESVFGRKPLYSGRGESASPATGFQALHRREQQELIHEAFEM